VTVGIDDVRAAARRITGRVIRTPLLTAPWAGDLWLKPESLQPIGAFKVRGALSAIAALDPQVRAAGVVTHSSGNHAQAVAWAARQYGAKAVVVMPEAASPVKIDATRRLGAEVVLVPVTERESAAAQIRDSRGLVLIPPYDHSDVIAGQGTVGAEVAEDLPDADTVLVPVGGGGLVSGIAVAVKALIPEARVVGVEPELAADAAESLTTGTRTGWPAELTSRTIADGVRTPQLGELTWPIIRTLVDEIVTVSEDAILEAIGLLAVRSRLVAEPSGALAVAGYLAEGSRFGRTVAIVSGGNVDPAVFAAALETAAGRPVGVSGADGPGPVLS
jgi:threonine dehydratase